MDIAAWLRELGLERYEGAFRDHAIDARILPELTAEDLKEIGVVAVGDRRRLLKAIAALTDGGAPLQAASGFSDISPKEAEAERRQLTVMFVDLVGSTELAARLDPEDMREIIRAYQNAVAGEIGRFAGHVAKFMGDGVLAYFGWPQAHEDDAERAARAGLAVVQAMGGMAAPQGQRLAVRVGIATGIVVVGDLVGEGAAQEEAVVGETPNLAARLQAQAAPGQVIVAERTRRLLGDLFQVADLGRRWLKGIALPVGSFAILGEGPVESRFEARSGPMLLPMIGRDQELALLLQRFALANAGQGQGVLLVGEAGIGKSRITRALLDALIDEPHTCIRYQCSPYHTDSALWPVIQQLTRAAGIAADDQADAELDKLEALLASTGDDAVVARLIASLIGVDGQSRYGPLDLAPQAQRVRTLEALVAQILALASKQLVLVVLEDAHWVDPSTLEMMVQCLDRIADRRVLLLFTSRPDHQPELPAHPHLTRLTLDRLGRSGVEAIVHCLDGDRLPPETIDAIITRTDGVPLFVEELTRAVVETGATTVPVSLHGSLIARLDRLPQAKEVAQIAACIGREFDHALLTAIADRPRTDLLTALDRLAAAGLIFCQGRPPDATYRFKHALVRDAAYESLLKSRRRVLHERICAVLERDFPQTAPEVLAAHAGAADRIEAAIGYWEQAGRAAYERAAHKEAIAHYRGALDLLSRLPDTPGRRRKEAGLLIGLGAPTGSLVGYGAVEAEEIYRQALAVCDREPNPGAAAAAAALGAICLAQHCRGDERAAKETAERELAEAERDGEWAALEAAYSDLGDALYMLGELSAAADTLRRISEDQSHDSEATARITGRDAVVLASSIRALALWQLGMPDTALATIEAALTRGSRSPRPLDRIFPVCFAAKVHLLRREYAEARRYAERAVQLGEETGVVHFLYDGLIWLGWALTGLNATDDGLAAIRRGMEGRRAIESFVSWPLFLVIHAYALKRAGQPDLALATLEDAMRWTVRGGDRHWLAEIHRQRAGIALEHERSDIDAEAELQRALDVARVQEARSQELRAARDLARLWTDRGERQEARDLLAPIYGWFTEGFDSRDLIEAKALLDQLR